MRFMGDYCVYKHTSPSGKVYVGITNQPPRQRWKNGRGYRYQRYLSQAIQKYGWGNFRHEVLFTDLTREEAAAKEIEMIALYKSNQREFGYNIESGGFRPPISGETSTRLRKSLKGRRLSYEHRKSISDGLRGHKTSEETRQKLREKNRGKTMSPEARAKMSESHKGLRPSPETIAKWRESNKSLMTPVEQIDIETNTVVGCFESTRDAFRNTGIDSSSITACCHGRRKTAGGYKWRFPVETIAV